MTSRLFKDFNDRAREVSKYFIFLKNLEQETIKLSMEGMDGKTKVKKLSSELEKTLKASAFLLLYNLVESTMRNAIETIFEELKYQKLSFDTIRPELKKIVIKNFQRYLQKQKHDRVILHITEISLDIINICFDKENLFSGNLDSRRIKDTAKNYGFSYETDPVKTGNGSDLLTIKNNRNDLAHGIKSFAEVGRDQTADDLLKIKCKVVKYLSQILENIETYIVNQEYLDASKSKF
jgi:MAE_28990/MAE_18760-like HEPN